MMSWIERRAFSVMMRQETASIKDMRPIDVPANQFSYHLGNLIQKGYVQKIDRGAYALTPSGLQYAGTMSTTTRNHRDSMKTVIVLYGRANDGRVALFEWSRQPYLGKTTLPHDRMAYDSTLDAAVTTACIDKLGKRVAVEFITSTIMSIMHQGQIVSRMHGLVYEFNADDVSFPHEARNGTLSLVRLDECEGLMEGVSDFVQRLAATTDAFPLEVAFTY